VRTVTTIFCIEVTFVSVLGVSEYIEMIFVCVLNLGVKIRKRDMKQSLADS